VELGVDTGVPLATGALRRPDVMLGAGVPPVAVGVLLARVPLGADALPEGFPLGPGAPEPGGGLVAGTDAVRVGAGVEADALLVAVGVGVAGGLLAGEPVGVAVPVGVGVGVLLVGVAVGLDVPLVGVGVGVGVGVLLAGGCVGLEVALGVGVAAETGFDVGECAGTAPCPRRWSTAAVVTPVLRGCVPCWAG
jgi:hypothetical protein